MSPILSLRDVRRTYGEPPVAACAGVSLEIERGELVAVVGLIFDGDTGGLTEHFVYTVRSLERMGVSLSRGCSTCDCTSSPATGGSWRRGAPR